MLVGHEQRLFAAHEDVLSRSPFFDAALKGQFLEAGPKQVDLPDEYGCSVCVRDALGLIAV